MKCMICDSKTHYYFSKKYTERPFDRFMMDIGVDKVDYFRCDNCGFVISETHRHLDKSKWESINHRFHHYIESCGDARNINQPPYAEQAMMISLLSKNKIIDADSIVDFAGGYGTLSNVLSKYFDINLPIYEPYVTVGAPGRYLTADTLRTYKTVINSAMFEHVLNRSDIEQVSKIVEPDGSLIIHTVVCETIPKDPDWFYLRPPVHTAFHTNKSMEILMEQWNYRSSIYSPKSKCWVLLRDDISRVKEDVNRINTELQTNWLFCKNGFMDYWKD